jgi:hypothetical protein
MSNNRIKIKLINLIFILLIFLPLKVLSEDIQIDQIEKKVKVIDFPQIEDPSIVQKKSLDFEDELDGTLSELSTGSGMGANIDLVEGSGGSALSSFLANVQKNMFEKLVKENPLAHLSKEQIRDFISERAKETQWQQIFSDYPKLLDFIVEWFADKKALPSLINIMARKNKLTNYTVSFFVILILGMILNILLTKKGSILKHLAIKLSMTFFTMLAQLGAFYFIFREELTPTIEIATRVFF